MTLSQRGVDLIKSFEGFRSKPYGDVAGIQTVGFGHVIKDGEKFTQVTEQAAEKLLFSDTIQASNCVNVHVTSPLNQNQFDALVSFVYNVGCGTFKESTLLLLLNQEIYDKASQQFLRFDHAGGKVIHGLAVRRQKEKELFDTPESTIPIV